jgi:predicted nucleotidyltransferase
MQTVEKLKSTLALHKEELNEKLKVNEIVIFGSYVRREQKKEKRRGYLGYFLRDN